MDALSLFPVEVWEVICKYASTDGGYTARSLSLVSRTLYQASKGSRHHSLIITRWNQLCYALTLIQQDPKYLGEVHHLFVTLSDFILDDLTLYELDDDEDEYVPPAEDVDTEGTSSEEDSDNSDLEEAGESDPSAAGEGTNIDRTEDDELAVDIAYFSSEEGHRHISLVDSSQTMPFQKTRLEALKQLLTSEACQNLESLALKLEFLVHPMLLEFLPPLPRLVRLTVIGAQRVLWRQDEHAHNPYFPSLLDFQIWDKGCLSRSVSWVSHLPTFVRHHMPQLRRLRTPMPYFDEQRWADRLLQEDTFPGSMELIMFEHDVNRALHPFRFDGEMVGREHLIRRIQLYAREKARMHRLIRYWKEEIQGGYGSWPRPGERKPCDESCCNCHGTV